MFDSTGNLYGTTSGGGSISCSCGTVFRLAPASGGGWTKTTLYAFTNGGLPAGPLVFDATGNLYGSAVNGGSLGWGTVFKLSPTADGSWKETVLHTFSGGIDGALPIGGLTLIGDALYGATREGGLLLSCPGTGCGLAFKLSPASNGAWKKTVLHYFIGGADGSTPASGLTFDSAGNLFGVTEFGGSTRCSTQGCGVAFKLSPSSSGWKASILHAFTGSDDGSHPVAPLTLDTTGSLFGETIDPVWCTSFISTCGVVFKLSSTNGVWQVSALYQIPGEWQPSGGVLLDSAGNIFGMGNGPSETGASGVFEITP